ncbi:MAG: 30S ribosomal protein S3 [Myxococcales bacterium]|mgnify:CR=1 FL=1|nr:30S ribosomal protein S3 [Myxococcales bacterium]
MGQKVHPYGFRLGYIRPWLSRWFDEKNTQQKLHEDIKIRKLIEKRLSHASISTVEIERQTTIVKIRIHTARPGLVIGKKGVEAEGIKALVTALTGCKVFLDVVEIRRPELDAKLVAEGIAVQIERRVAFRRAMKKSVLTSLKFGAKGVRVQCSGRLGGAEMGRREWYRKGRVPLHTLRADVDYGFALARTTYGVIGVKCWLYRGDILAQEQEEPQKTRQRSS